MRYLAVVAASAVLFACSKEPAQNKGANQASVNGVEAGAAPNSASRNEAAAAPAPDSSDPVALAAANLARDEQGQAPGAPPLEQVYPEAKGMPADVQEYIVRHHGCMHWGGEPDFNAERRKQIEEAVASLCPGIDQLGRQIRSRYAGNREVLDRIKDLEPLEE
jgi:hypothetical protein